MKTSVKANLIANLLGKIWVALIGFAFIPVYLRLLGVEAYGLVGYYAAIQPVLFLIDMGLSTTLNRELARFSTQPDSAADMRRLVRTLEIAYWIACSLIAVGFAAAAPYIAAHGVNAHRLAIADVTFDIRLMGLSLALQFPFSLYQGGLLGLQRQVALNGVLIASSTLRAAGAALILWKVAPTAAAYFEWQCVVSLLQTIAAMATLQSAMPATAERERFSKVAFAGIWRFAANMSVLSVLSVILTQLDKLVLSKMLSLEKFGYYSVATSAVACLYVIINPMFTAVFPRFTQMLAVGDDNALSALYHRSCQTMSVLLAPVVVAVAAFSPELIWAWTGNRLAVENAHLPLTLLAIGSGINGLVMLPYALQLASGWTKLTLHTFLVCIALEVPALFFAIKHYGAVGAAGTWALLNVCFVPVMVYLMHKRLLPGQMGTWYRYDILYPVGAAAIVGLLARAIAPHDLSRVASLATLALVGAFTLAATAFAAPYTRGVIVGRLTKTVPAS